MREAVRRGTGGAAEASGGADAAADAPLPAFDCRESPENFTPYLLLDSKCSFTKLLGT